jgi:glycosyltransferase involved in cell wall biosynthesis
MSKPDLLSEVPIEQNNMERDRRCSPRSLRINLFTGRVDRELIPDIFYDLDVSITTHRAEPFGIAHIESLASYTPVIAYNDGGPVEILAKGGGVLVDGGAKKMSDAVYRVISDHELRRSLGLEGRKSAESHFSVDTMGEKTLQLYKKTLGIA